MLCTFTIGCDNAPDESNSPAPSSTPSSNITLNLLAAASTVNVAEAIAAGFEKKHRVNVKVVSGPSNALAQQIINGAPADLFLSASTKWIEPLQEKKLIAETRPLLGNTLVIAVPKNNPAGVTSPDDLKNERVQRIALAGENVPAGMYADEALKTLMLYDDLLASGKIVRGHDVRVTLSYIERGEVEAGIVYVTDVIGSTKAEAVYSFPEDVSPLIVLPLTLLKNSQHPQEAKLLYDHMSSPDAQTVYKRHGFSALASEG
ncbi:MAG: molybdate ABC transporter substrate-binding protein [Planctomycetota bacterium]|nr:molybdate ABC transporter substrate-binding protein [Planctomycetota bacterium]MDA1212905.1 molybdate ABC transporter substrate-binding protein [Planctomycetota bacterium]